MRDGVLRGALGIATVALVVLKLMGEIGWSWLVVFAPLWVPAVISVGLRVASVAVAGVLVYLLLTGGGLEQIPEILERIPLVRELPWESLFS